MLSAVLDTNILASGTLTATTPPGQILDAWRNSKFSLVVSEHIITELKNTFNKPYFQRHLSATNIGSFIDLLLNETIFTTLTVKVEGVATHPADDLTLATVLSSKADYLVTGDGPLLRKLGSTFQGTNVVNPGDFLRILQQEE